MRQRGLGERLPDQRGERPAGDRLSVELGQHRLQRVRVSDPDGDDELRRVPDEPRVTVVLGRPGLAGDRTVGERRALAGSRLHDVLQQRVHGLRRRLAQHRDGSHLVLERLLLPGLLDADDRAGNVAEDRPVEAETPGRERRVRARELERVDRLGAEPDREVRVELAADAERAGGRAHGLRADDLGQLRVDGVVRVRGRVVEADRPEIGVVVVRHVPGPVAERDRDRLRDERRPRRDALLQPRREDERLEGRARLALRLRGEVELALAEVPSPDHCDHAAVARVDRDERGSRPFGIGEPLRDRAPRRLLQREVDRRRDAVARRRTPWPRRTRSINCCFT